MGVGFKRCVTGNIQGAVVGNLCGRAGFGKIISSINTPIQNIQNGSVLDVQGTSMKNDAIAGLDGRGQGICQAILESLPGSIQSQSFENILQILFRMKTGKYDGSGSCHGIAVTIFIAIQMVINIACVDDGIVKGDCSASCASGKFK